MAVYGTDCVLISRSKRPALRVNTEMTRCPTKTSSARQQCSKITELLNFLVSCGLTDGLLLFPRQFTCSRDSVEECVASEHNVTNVTLCLLRNLSTAAEDGLTLCSSQTMACHLPEVTRRLCLFSFVCMKKQRRNLFRPSPIPARLCRSISATACC